MKKHATPEHYEKIVKQANKTQSVQNGHATMGGAKPTAKAKVEDDGDGSELSQTSDIEPMIEDDDDIGEEQKENV